MAETAVVACPNCDKQFRVAFPNLGSKLRCKACAHIFIAQSLEETQVPSVQEIPKAVVPKASDDDDDDGCNYGMNIEKDVPRCPNCSKELRSETDIICINCGFNNRTRSLNRVMRVQYKGTWDYALWHALPVLHTCIIIGTIVLLVLYYLRWYQWALDNRQESVLAWLLCNQVSQIYIWVAALSVFWKCGKPAFMRFFVHPHPPEEEVLGK